MNVFQIFKNSDAVFHEESEYVIAFLIRVGINYLWPIFRSSIFLKSQKIRIFYENCIVNISMKTQANPNKSITKILSLKSSTNGESFTGFGGGHRIDLAISHGYTQNVFGFLTEALLKLKFE